MKTMKGRRTKEEEVMEEETAVNIGDCAMQVRQGLWHWEIALINPLVSPPLSVPLLSNMLRYLSSSLKIKKFLYPVDSSSSHSCFCLFLFFSWPTSQMHTLFLPYFLLSSASHHVITPFPEQYQCWIVLSKVSKGSKTTSFPLPPPPNLVQTWPEQPSGTRS